MKSDKDIMGCFWMNNKKLSVLYIITFLVVSMAFGNNYGINVQSETSLNSYQALQAGDTLLYEVYNWFEDEYNHLLYLEQETPDVFSDKSYDNFFFEQIELHSFVVTGAADPTYLTANETMSSYPKTNYNYHEYWHYDYSQNKWVSDWVDEYSFEDPPKSDVFFDISFDVYQDTLNLDLGFWFYEAVYVENYNQTYIINGVPFEINITHYSVYHEYTSSWEDGFYDLPLYVEQNNTNQIDYYIDTDTGFLIEYEEFNTFEEKRWVDDYSSELQTHVILNDTLYNENYFNWKLVGANCQYAPLAEVDLPYIVNYYDVSFLTIENDTDYVVLPLELYTSSNNLTAEISLVNWDMDGPNVTLYDRVENLTNGYWEYWIPVTEFEYVGPYYYYDVLVTLYDGYNVSHNSTWHIGLQDNRVIIPDWPSWYEGPDYIEVGEWEFWDQPYDVYSDTYWFVDIYRYTDDPMYPMEFIDHWEGYQNGTFWLHHREEPEGEYQYEIVFWDQSGAYINMTVTVKVVSGSTSPEDTDPPVITGEGPDIYIKEGEDKTLTYKITDENPDHVMVKRNGTVIIDEDMTSSPYYIDIDLSTLGEGTYIFSIDAWDIYDNHNIWDITVYVSSSSSDTNDTSPTDDTGTNTFDLDAPNGLIVGISLFSVSALVVLLKKKR